MSKLYVFMLVASLGVNFALGSSDVNGKDEDAENVKTPFGYTISEQTTGFTSPIAKDGSLDIVAAIDSLLRGDAKRENNLAVTVFAIDQHSLSGSIQADKIAKALKLTPPVRQPSFCDYASFEAKLRFQSMQAGSDDVLEITPNEQLNEMTENPWRAADYPSVKQWLDANKVPLDCLLLHTVGHASARMTDYYVPFVSDIDGSVFNSLNVSLPRERLLQQALQLRAMASAGSGKFDAAIDDLLAGIKLARIQSGKGFLIHELISFIMQRRAYQALQKIALSGKLTTGQLKALQEKLSNMPPQKPFSLTWEKGERAFQVGCILDMAHMGTDFMRKHAKLCSFDYQSQDDILYSMPAKSIDFDEFLIGSNYSEGMDFHCSKKQIEAEYQFVQGDKNAPRPSPVVIGRYMGKNSKRLAAIELAFWADLDKAEKVRREFKDELLRRYEKLTSIDNPSEKKQRGRIHADYQQANITSFIVSGADVRRRFYTQLELLEIVVALELYKSDIGKYPESLNDLFNNKNGYMVGELFDLQGYPYIYGQENSGGNYKLLSTGKDLISGTDDDITPSNY